MEKQVKNCSLHSPRKRMDLDSLSKKLCREHSLRIRKRKSCKKMISDLGDSLTKTKPNNLFYSKRVCKICSKEDFSFLKKIGEGSFGLVYKARHKKKQKTYAIKQMGGSLSTYQDLLRKIDEVGKLCEFLSYLFNNYDSNKQLNIVPIYGIWEQNSTLYTVMKYYPSGDLSRFTVQYLEGKKTKSRKKQRRTIRRKKSHNQKRIEKKTRTETTLNTTKTTKKTETKTKTEMRSKTKTNHQNKGVIKTIISEDQIWKWIYDIASGLKLIHENGFIHLDLKPANLLFCKKYNKILICDLGLITPVGAKISSEGDNRYSAPELTGMSIIEEVIAQTSMDIYSLGISMYELTAQITLPKDGNEWDQLRNIKSVDQSSNTVLPFNVPRSRGLKSLITKMMLKNPQDRITLDEILQLPQMKKIENNHNLTSKKVSHKKMKMSSSFVCNIKDFRNKIKNKYKTKKSIKSLSVQKKLFVFDNKDNNLQNIDFQFDTFL
ncbi:membrane-associated tyrosine- and threonine-specific cdc2-inhibitory kinase [Anaeramoeba flamelloides]|uniref:Membrane-associated tyrosine- and threonine-specific cdc2-inhibitory kinase n=1 Tax=Anaeramoeba flamelloides TaxID=1746091 RepID=A0AAV7YU09_9EUKA|nr:membrane-associated tyrosine- and threonine-specific cdc2-inhibitory kinase [Anaeramoeba flamelloides]